MTTTLKSITYNLYYYNYHCHKPLELQWLPLCATAADRKGNIEWYILIFEFLDWKQEGKNCLVIEYTSISLVLKSDKKDKLRRISNKH